MFIGFTGRTLRDEPAQKVSRFLVGAGMPQGRRSTGRAGKTSTMRMWPIMRRDLLKLSRNPLTLMSIILMPIVYLVIMGNSFNGQLKHLSMVVVSQDHGLYARRMVEKAAGAASRPQDGHALRT